VVGTNSGGIPDAVIHEKTGWLAEPGDSGSLADALKLALLDTNSFIIESSKQFASERYLVNNTVAKFINKITLSKNS
jgi:glycosyltransferase involved in cell wall biosynthesis